MAAAPNPANGTDTSSWAAIIAAGSFMVQLVMNAGTLVWALARSKSSTDDKIADKDKASAMAMAALERDIRDELVENSRSFGETASALRQKITETELWNRDNFVSKQTFNSVITDMRRSLEQLGDRVDGRFDRLEDKLDGRSTK